jgi:hypothetical protein
MKTALKVTLIPSATGISFDASVGIFGQQALPTIISMLFFWPVIITQIWGLIEQSKLDDKALKIAQDTISATPIPPRAHIDNKFCTNCGAPLLASAKFCCNCGQPLE